MYLNVERKKVKKRRKGKKRENKYLPVFVDPPPKQTTQRPSKIYKHSMYSQLKKKKNKSEGGRAKEEGGKEKRGGREREEKLESGEAKIETQKPLQAKVQ